MFDLKQELENTAKPEIIFVWNYLEWGGGQIYLLAIMKEAKPNWRIRVILPRGSSQQILTFIEQIGVEYELIDAHLDLAPAPTLGRKLQRHLNKIRCEWRTLRYLSRFHLSESILHIDMAPWQSLVALLYLISQGNVFVTMHNSLPPAARWRVLQWRIKFAILARFKRFHLFVANQDTKNSLSGFLSQSHLEKVKVTYASINPEEIAQVKSALIERDELLKQYNLPLRKFLVFCVGQFIDRKGRWTFLAAAQLVLQEHHDMSFVWISNSNLTPEEADKIAAYNLGDNFHLIEANKVIKDRQQLLTLIATADLFVLASLVEGLPIALLEAMALEIACISTNVNGIPEAVRHLETGWLIRPGDDHALADAIVRLKSDSKLRLKLARIGRKRVLENFIESVSANIAIAEYLASLNLDAKQSGYARRN